MQRQLNEVREKIDEWHKKWFQLAVDIASEVDTELPTIPRRCNRQTQRSNVEADSPEVYYRRALTIPFLDHLLSELEFRFSTNVKIAALGLCLVPSILLKRDDWEENIMNLAALYEIDLPTPLSLETE